MAGDHGGWEGVVMATAQRRGSYGWWFGAAGFLTAVWSPIAGGPATSRADVIVLRGGGQVQGKVVPDPKRKDRVQILLLQGRHPLSFEKSRVVEVIPQPSPLDEYIVRRAKAAGRAESQFEVGSWCEQNKLPDLARLHYETALGLDADFAPAHKKLGHVYHDGSWLTRDDLSAAQGLIKYKGRWITAEAKSKREAEAQITALQGSWVRRLKLLRQSLLNGKEDRRREAEAQLMAIRDADAVVPLVRVFGQDDRPRRIVLAQVLSAIGGREASTALVRRVLDEPDNEVRSITFDHLKLRGDDGVAGQFARALLAADIEVINRAAWALGNLNALEAVPRLVAVLITSEQRIVLEPPPGVGGVGPAMPAGPGPTLRGMTNGGVVLQSPPAISNGVVAYGVAAVPWYQMTPGVATAAGLNPGVQINQMPEPKVATFTYRNVEVLAALQKLTGQDFGYDVDAWHKWVSQSFNPNPRPARRVPQP
jgi:hypothetical protein